LHNKYPKLPKQLLSLHPNRVSENLYHTPLPLTHSLNIRTISALWLRNYSSNPDLFLGGREFLHLWTHRDLNSNLESQLGSERKRIDKPRMM